MHIYLPRDDGLETAGEQTRKLPLANGSDAAADRVILVIDDDPDVRQVAAEYLERIGFTVREAESGPKALEMLDRGDRIDLLLVDFAMPEMDGAELLRRVRRLRPGLPALMVTGYVKDRASLDAVEVEVLRKPFPLATLGARVRELLGLTPGAPHSRAGAAAGRPRASFAGRPPPGRAIKCAGASDRNVELPRFRQKFPQPVARRVPHHEAVADPARQDQRDRAVAHLLVLAHVSEQPVGRVPGKPDLGKRRRQSGCGQMPPDAVRLLPRSQTETHGEIERQHHPERDRLAVQQPRRRTRFRLPGHGRTCGRN